MNRFARTTLRWLTRFALVLLVACGLVVGLWLRTAERGQAALERSDAAFDAGRLQVALDEARVAAACAVPGADHVAAADARLFAIAVGAEAHGNERLARRAWAALRGAALERRHPWGREPILDHAERQLARLLAAANLANKERVLGEEELRTELLESRPSIWGSPWGSLVLVPLFAALGMVFARGRAGARGEGA